MTQRIFASLLPGLAALLLAACQALPVTEDDTSSGPVDPFDYNYCGGVPVYPVIGVSFATYCGPRNQVSLGRYGTLMWLFPAVDGSHSEYQGKRKLTVAELKQLSLLAEVAQLADPLEPQPGALNYQIGINFSGRDNKRLRGVRDGRYSPANQLLDAMLSMVPGIPTLPECNAQIGFFDPVVLPGKRRAMTQAEMLDTQGYSYAIE